MNILPPNRRQVFPFPLVLAALAVNAIWPAPPSNAQQRRASTGSEIAANYAEAADKLAEENRWPEAIDAYKLVIRQHPKYGPAYKGLGNAYLNSGEWENALATYKDAVRVAPKDAEAWYDLGYCYNVMGRHGEAFAPLVRATGLDPGFAEAFYEIGYAYLRGTEIEKSLTWLKGAIRLNPDYPEAYYGLALVYTRLGKSDLAGEARKKLFNLDAKLVEKLDREIRTPQSALAGPLPPIITAEPPKTPAETKSNGALVVQDPAAATPPQTTLVEARTPASKVGTETLSGPDAPPQNPTAAIAANDKRSTAAIEEPSSRTDLSAREDSEPTSRQLPKPGSEQLQKETVVPHPDPKPARVDGSTQPGPTESAMKSSTPWPVSVWPAKSKRWALVIGVDNYREESHNNWLGSSNDAQTLRDALIQFAGFPADQVILLSSNQPLPQQPGRNSIVQSLSNLRGRVPKDGLLLVSFAGHGIEREGRSYLLPSDAPAIDDVSLLEYTTINVERLKELIRAIGVTQVLLILDASRNDPTPGRGASDNPMTSNFSKSFSFDLNRREVTSFATLYATTVGQRAYGDSAKKQGYFTSALVEGLGGEAANDKGEVTLANLVKYVQETVPKNVNRDLGANKQQVPFAVIQGYKEDELVIAAGVKKSP